MRFQRMLLGANQFFDVSPVIASASAIPRQIQFLTAAKFTPAGLPETGAPFLPAALPEAAARFFTATTVSALHFANIFL